MAKSRKSKGRQNAQTKSVLDKSGHEIPDPAPIAPALELARAPSLAERIRQEIRSQAFTSQLKAEQETFDEADDFEVGDDFDPSSPYEEEFEGQFDQRRQVDPRPQAAPPKAEPAPSKPVAGTPEPTPPKSGGSA